MCFFFSVVFGSQRRFFLISRNAKKMREYVGMIVYVGACCEIFVYDASRLELRMKYMGLSSF